MDPFKVIEIKQSVFENNDKQADLLREELREQGVFLLNLMSSPGSGKTTTLVQTVQALRNSLRLGILEADIDSDVDARTVADAGGRVVQLHTGGMCHLTAEMTRQGLDELLQDSSALQELDLIFLENVGNLVCPAEFDTGAVKNAMILSVPEGDDKPLKYPAMFRMADLLLVNKMDAAGFFEFDLEALTQRARELNPDITVIPITAKTGEGMAPWYDWIRTETAKWKK